MWHISTDMLSDSRGRVVPLLVEMRWQQCQCSALCDRLWYYSVSWKRSEGKQKGRFSTPETGRICPHDPPVS